MQAILLFSVGYILLLFPIFISCYFLAENENNKIYFSVSLFGISIIGGCAIFNSQGIVFDTGYKRYPLLFEDYIMKRKKFSKAKGVGVRQIKGCIICGIKNIKFMQVTFLSKILQQNLFPVIKQKYPYLSLNNDIALLSNSKIYFVNNIKIVTNILSLLLYLFSKLVEKVINGKQKQRAKSN